MNNVDDEQHTSQPKIRVLVVDNDALLRNDAVANLVRWGYEPIVAEGKGRELLANAGLKAREHRCHLALVDMRLLDDHNREDRSGLDLVQDLRPAVSIIVSSHGDPITTIDALRNKGAFYFLGKQEGPRKLRKILDEASRMVSSVKRELRISWPPGLSETDILERLGLDATSIPLDQVNDVLGQLFPEAQTIRVHRFSSTKRLISSVNQASLLVKVESNDRQAVLVRLVQPSDALVEKQRYSSFIDGKFDVGFYVHVQQAIPLWDIAGVQYEFRGCRVDEIKSFSVCYSDHSIADNDLKQALSVFFDQVWSKFYHNTRNKVDRSLFALYTDYWGMQWKNLLRNVTNNGEWISFGHRLGNLDLWNPITWLLNNVGLVTSTRVDRSDVAEAFTAIIHGNLNGDNLFVGQDKKTWVIDYQNAGQGPILQDFVTLETDILTRLVQFEADDLPILYDLVYTLTSCSGFSDSDSIPAAVTGHPEVNRAIVVISEIRRLAHRQTHVRNFKQYLWGLLFNAVRRAGALTHQGSAGIQSERALLLSSVICHRLQENDTILCARWPRAMTWTATDNFDVFLSYSPADEEWVHDWLIPNLEQQGIYALTSDNFEIGSPRLINVERAVQRCRKTLLVLSPNWLASEWNSFESLLLQTADPANIKRRLIPLLLTPCGLPARLDILTPADFSQPIRWEQSFQRVVKAISDNDNFL